MYVGDKIDGIGFELRPGVTADQYSHPDQLVWRYVPLPYFLDAVRTGTLFFTRLSYHAVHSDRREGSASRSFAQIREGVLREQGVDIEQYNKDAAQFWLTMLQTVLVNCWHKREHESEPMWERYSKTGDSVAIVSTLNQLVEAVPENVTVGHVEYIDFASEWSWSANPRDRAFLKSRTLEDEREVRAVLVEPPITRDGRWAITIPPGEEIGHRVPVKLSTLVTRVVLSPKSVRCADDVLAALAAAGIAAPVDLSECCAGPRY